MAATTKPSDKEKLIATAANRVMLVGPGNRSEQGFPAAPIVIALSGSQMGISACRGAYETFLLIPYNKQLRYSILTIMAPIFENSPTRKSGRHMEG